MVRPPATGWQRLVCAALCFALGFLWFGGASRSSEVASSVLQRLGAKQGICVLLGDQQGEFAVQLARAGRALVYLQVETRGQARAAREAADSAGLLGSRVFVDRGSLRRIHLADNLADAVVARLPRQRLDERLRSEILRVLHPGGRARVGNEPILYQRANARRLPGFFATALAGRTTSRAVSCFLRANSQ